MKLFELFGEIALKGDAQVNTSIDAVSKKAESVVPKIENIGKAFDKSGKFMSLWVTGPIVAAGAAALALGSKLGETADRIGDLTAITGMSAKAIQQYQYVSKIAGAETEATTNAMRMFTAQLDQVVKGTGSVSTALIKLGIDTKAFIELTPDQQLDAMIEALQALPSPVERARVGVELFGRQWQQLAPIVDMGSAALAKAKAEGDRFAMNENQLNAANNFRIALEQLKAEFGLAAQQLGLAFIPAMTELIPIIRDQVVPAILFLAEKGAELALFFAGLDPSIQMTVAGFMALVAALGPMLIIIGKIIAAGSAVSAAFAGIGLSVTGILPVLAGLTAAIAAGIAIWQNWDAIVQEESITLDALGIMFDDLIASVTGFGSEFSGVFRNLSAEIPAYITTMASSVISTITGMVESAIGAVENMYDAIVGGSIIPDMVDDVSAEMGRMAKAGTEQADKFSSNVQRGLSGIIMPTLKPQIAIPDIESPVIEPIVKRPAKMDFGFDAIMAPAIDMFRSIKSEMGSITSPRLAPAYAGEGNVASMAADMRPTAATYNVDMRWSTFKDDKDMYERLARSGAGYTGAAI